MIDFLQLASTTATQVLFPDQGLLYNDNFRTARGIRADKMVLFVEGHMVHTVIPSAHDVEVADRLTVGGPNLLMPSSR